MHRQVGQQVEAPRQKPTPKTALATPRPANGGPPTAPQSTTSRPQRVTRRCIICPELMAARLVTGVPASAPHELRRERLLEVLHRHSTRPLILLVAPAGFGKSTLAATYARDSGAVVAWLTLQATDRDSRRLFTRLAYALESAFEEADSATVGRLSELRRGLDAGSEGTGLARLVLSHLGHAPAGFFLG